jgi:hypothetical protein
MENLLRKESNCLEHREKNLQKKEERKNERRVKDKIKGVDSVVFMMRVRFVGRWPVECLAPLEKGK